VDGLTAFGFPVEEEFHFVAIAVYENMGFIVGAKVSRCPVHFQTASAGVVIASDNFHHGLGTPPALPFEAHGFHVPVAVEQGCSP